MARKVFVYRNIRNDSYSVRDCKTGRVIKRVKRIRLRDCVFRVGEAGRQRVLTTGQKNVHAGVVGYISRKNIQPGFGFANYRPKHSSSFYDILTKQPLTKADVVHLLPRGIVLYR